MLLLVLLRIGIGWHLAYEGYWKVQSHVGAAVPWDSKRSKPWSGEMYLRNATGPLRSTFRQMIPDFHSLEKLDANRVVAGWREFTERLDRHYTLTAEQKTQLEAKIEELSADLEQYLAEEQAAVEYYRDQVAQWEANEPTGKSPVLAQRHWDRQQELWAEARELTGPVDDLTGELGQFSLGVLSDTQKALPPPQKTFFELSQVEQADRITMWGLFGCGCLLIVGLFSRLSAFGAACLLFLFYISMPPWPGLPPNPQAEGNYLIVNKNLIEMLALLVLATLPTGVWGGLDALIRAFITRPLFRVGVENEEDDD